MTKNLSLVMLLVISLLSPKVIPAEGFKYAEIFDPRQEKVVKVVQVNDEIHNMIAISIEDISGIYGKNNPVTDDGYAIKIPLEPAVTVHGKWLKRVVSEVYIIIPKNDPPFFLIFENDNNLSCFPFNGDIDTLSKLLDFQLKIS